MKTKGKKLTLNQAAKRMAKITQEYLDRLPPTERERKLKAFQALAAKASSQLQRDPADIPAMSGISRRALGSPVLARGQR